MVPSIALIDHLAAVTSLLYIDCSIICTILCVCVCVYLQAADGEIYKASTFFKARSFRIGLVFSLLLVILIVIVVIAVPVAIVGMYAEQHDIRLSVWIILLSGIKGI